MLGTDYNLDLGKDQFAPVVTAAGTFSWRDCIIMPLLVLATMAVMFGVAEFTARLFWVESGNPLGCTIYDPSGLIRNRPNCIVRAKIAEGPWVTSKYNECGYRTTASCGPKPAGTLRIAFVGTSITDGYAVPFEETLAERTSRALTRATNRTVENENMGVEGQLPLVVYRRLQETLALRPDLIVWQISPFDLYESLGPEAQAARNDPEFKILRTSAPVHFSTLTRLKLLMNESRTVVMAQHFLYSDTDKYVRLFLSRARGDRNDYLAGTVTKPWLKRYADLNVLLTGISQRLRRAQVPMIVVAVPSRQIAALLTTDDRLPQYDPFAFGRNLQRLVEPLGIGYVDGTREFSEVPHSDHLFYPLNHHLTGEGNMVLARALIRRCLAGDVPAFATSTAASQELTIDPLSPQLR